MKEDRFKSLIAILIAVITVLGASAACFSSVAVSNANDADFAGLDASLRAEKADIINHVTAMEHYRAYTEYVRYNKLGFLLFEEGGNSSEAWGLADGLSFSFFNTRYLNPDGTYDLERELQEAFAQDAQLEDLNALPYFTESDALRNRSSFLSANMIVFAVSFWFLTLAQAAEKKIKYVWLALGVLLGIAGIIGLLVGGMIR
jgi:ABC-type glycerol-3-phosphate transport system substrate-binding protein